jgi:signal transduction histidine kinase
VTSARSGRPPSLARRLILLAAGWSLAVLVVAGIAMTNQFQRAALMRFDRDLSELREGLFSQAMLDPDGGVSIPDSIDQRAQRSLSGKYWQVDVLGADGGFQPEVRSRSLDEYLLPPPPKSMPVRPGKPVFYDSPGPLGQSLRVTAYLGRLEEDPEHRTLVFMAAEDRSPLDRDARHFAYTAATALVVLMLGLIAAIVFQVRIGLQPLFALSRDVAKVRKGESDQVSTDYPVEIAPLAEELNALLAHNQEVVERQRTHVGNLAHALKTPLSVMLAETQARPGPLAEVVERQAKAMQSHVEHHLRRARAAARSQGQRERTSIAEIVDELARTLERIFQDKGVTIDWDAPDDLYFQGERQDLLEIVGNVMENACKWARRHVRVRAQADGPRQLRVVIDDDGPGLPPDQRQAVLQRGARLDEHTPGSGLGLSIVDELAKAYGGQVRLDAGAAGGL